MSVDRNLTERSHVDSALNGGTVSRLEQARLLVVHGGSAHRDDLLTVCVLLGRYPCLEVERRQPTTDELADPSVIVADVGLSYEPALNNFDHHHLPSEVGPTCALTLVLRVMGLEQVAKEAWPWLQFTEMLDSCGPTVVAKTFGLSRDALRAMFSPIERAILRDFSSQTRILPGSSLHEHLQAQGRALIGDLESVVERLELLKRAAVRVQVEDLNALDLRAVSPEPMRSIELFSACFAPEVAILITCNERGPGWTLWRRNDHPRVDFRRLQGLPGVSFVHQTGFMAVLDPEADPLKLSAKGVHEKE